jgi:hypothetical protein
MDTHCKFFLSQTVGVHVFFRVSILLQKLMVHGVHGHPLQIADFSQPDSGCPRILILPPGRRSAMALPMALHGHPFMVNQACLARTDYIRPEQFL